LTNAGAVEGTGEAPPAQPSAPVVQIWLGRKFFEPTFIVLSCLFAAAAYFDSHTYEVTGRSSLEPWQDAAVDLAWLLMTAFLVAVMAVNIRRGNPVTRSLPAGYGWSLVGCLAFSAVALLDRWGQQLFGAETSLSALISPPRVGEIVAGGLMVTGPLRAAWRRQDSEARLPAIVAAALLLSTITFVTQFAHPFRDLWPAGHGNGNSALATFWVAEDLGVAGLLLQGTSFAAIFLLLIRRFRIRFGSFAVICLINGALVVPLKGHWEMLAVAALTGLAADAGYAWLKPSPSQPGRLRAFAFFVPVAFAGLYIAAVAATYGTWWPVHVWAGAILVTGLGGLLVSYLAFPPEAVRAANDAGSLAPPTHWPQVTAGSVKQALEVLSDNRLLALSPLCTLPYLARDGGNPAAELADLLRDAARELATSTVFRDAQSGHVLVEYYVKRSGTHDQIAEQLHLSRPNYYRRLQRGCELLADRLDRLVTFTEDSQTT
jgi:hypothetical protein